jgi:hypothetical protein
VSRETFFSTHDEICRATALLEIEHKFPKEDNPMRRFQLAVSFLLAVLGSHSLMAATTYYVGGCKTATFTTIQDAVDTVPAGSTINVCPGTYAEQVTISKSLTLQGTSLNTEYGNMAQAIIAMPSTGLTTTSSLTQGTIAAQVQVTAGPVNITGITVDGTASSSTCPTVGYYGIFHGSGSSGTVNAVEIRNQNCYSGAGNGILAENGPGASETITIENNNIHDYSLFGIMANNEYSPPSLTAVIKSNSVTGPLGIFFSYTTRAEVSDNNVTVLSQGIWVGSAYGSVTNNFINVTGTGTGDSGIEVGAGTLISRNIVNTVNGANGIYPEAPGTISGNSVNNATNGITLDVGSAGARVTANRISNSLMNGIDVKIAGTTIESNIISKSAVAGIELNCNGGSNGGGTLTGNTINGAPIEIDTVPPGLKGTNKIYNAPTATTVGCI